MSLGGGLASFPPAPPLLTKYNSFLHPKRSACVWCAGVRDISPWKGGHIVGHRLHVPMVHQIFAMIWNGVKRSCIFFQYVRCVVCFRKHPRTVENTSNWLMHREKDGEKEQTSYGRTPFAGTSILMQKYRTCKHLLFIRGVSSLFQPLRGEAN